MAALGSIWIKADTGPDAGKVLVWTMPLQHKFQGAVLTPAKKAQWKHDWALQHGAAAEDYHYLWQQLKAQGLKQGPAPQPAPKPAKPKKKTLFG